MSKPLTDEERGIARDCFRILAVDSRDWGRVPLPTGALAECGLRLLDEVEGLRVDARTLYRSDGSTYQVGSAREAVGRRIAFAGEIDALRAENDRQRRECDALRAENERLMTALRQMGYTEEQGEPDEWIRVGFASDRTDAQFERHKRKEAEARVRELEGGR